MLETQTLANCGKCRNGRVNEIQRWWSGDWLHLWNAEVSAFAPGFESQELDYPSVRGSQLLGKESAHAEARKHTMRCVCRPSGKPGVTRRHRNHHFALLEKCRWNQLMFENWTFISLSSEVPKTILSVKSIWQWPSCLRTQLDGKALPASCYSHRSSLLELPLGRGRHGQADRHHHFAHRSAAMATRRPHQTRGFQLGYSANS